MFSLRFVRLLCWPRAWRMCGHLLRPVETNDTWWRRCGWDVEPMEWRYMNHWWLYRFYLLFFVQFFNRVLLWVEWFCIFKIMLFPWPLCWRYFVDPLTTSSHYFSAKEHKLNKLRVPFSSDVHSSIFEENNICVQARGCFKCWAFHFGANKHYWGWTFSYIFIPFHFHTSLGWTCSCVSCIFVQADLVSAPFFFGMPKRSIGLSRAQFRE